MAVTLSGSHYFITDGHTPSGPPGQRSGRGLNRCSRAGSQPGDESRHRRAPLLLSERGASRRVHHGTVNRVGIKAAGSEPRPGCAGVPFVNGGVEACSSFRVTPCDLLPPSDSCRVNSSAAAAPQICPPACCTAAACACSTRHSRSACWGGHAAGTCTWRRGSSVTAVWWR